MPPTLHDFYGALVPSLQLRVAGLSSFQIWPIESDLLPKLKISPEAPFFAVYSDDDTLAQVSSWADQSLIPPLVVSMHGDSPTTEQLNDHFQRVVDVVASSAPNVAGLSIAKKLVSEQPRVLEPFESAYGSSGTLLPTLTSFSSSH
jgi:hypothetical protein